MPLRPRPTRRAGRLTGRPPRLTVIKTWYQDDWGLFGRFDERVTLALARHPAVARVVHVSPPLSPADLRARSLWEHNLDRVLARTTGDGAELDGVWCTTPPAGGGLEAAVEHAAGVIERQLADRTRPVLLETPAHPFVVALAERLAATFPDLIRITQIEDDHRAALPDQAAAIDRVYRDHLAASQFGLVSSAGLRAEFAGLGTPLFLTPRVTEPARFAAAEPAADLADVPGPRVIYTGWLRSRLDLPLLRETVEGVPEATFVFVGPGGDALAEPLAGLPNWVAVGPRPYRHLPHLLAACDAAIVPHEVSPTTEGMTPEKAVHYLAAGLPVIGTPVAGLRDLPPLVRVAADGTTFAAAIRAELAADDPDRRRARRAAVADMDEDAVAAWLVTAVTAAVAGRPVPPPPAMAGPPAETALAAAPTAPAEPVPSS